MSEKQKNWGVTVLVSEIKRVGNAVFLEVLVIEGEIGFLATRNKISYVEDSRQCLFIYFIANRPISYIFACNIVSSGKIGLTEG